MLSNKIFKKYGDIWGELFRMKKKYATNFRAFDIYGKRPKNNDVYYRFSFYVGRFGVIRRRKTKYGKAFADKQKLKIFYNNIRESHIRRKWKLSLRFRGHAMFKFFHSLESRLDVLLYRSNYAFNMVQAQRLVESGMILINNTPMYDYKYMVKPFELVKLKAASSITRFLRILIKKRYKMFPLPNYLDVDYSTATILYTGVDTIPYFLFRVSVDRLRAIYH